MDDASPEVRSGAAFTTASDVYALGLLLYRLLTGRRPFSALGELVPPRKYCRCPLGLEGLILAMLEPSPDRRPALAGVLRALEAEQEEFAAVNEPQVATAGHAPVAAIAEPEAATIEIADKPEAAPVAHTDTRAAAPAAPARPVIAEPDAALVSTTNGAALTTTADIGAATSGKRRVEQAPVRRRAPGWWALGLTAALCLVIGRATGPRETDEYDASAPARPSHEVVEQAGAPVIDQNTEPSSDARPAEPPTIPPPVDDTPASTASPTVPSKRAGPRAPRREALSPANAEAAAESAVSSLRACKDVPRSVTAELDIVRGRGIVTALNLPAPAPDDPRYPWHGCARRALEGVRFPVSDTPGRVQVRLILR